MQDKFFNRKDRIMKHKIIVAALVYCFLCLSNIFAVESLSKKDDTKTKLEITHQSTKEYKDVVYKIGGGRIEIKPRLKYELIISLHVLKFAQDHHQLFVPWAQQMRKDLSEKTLQDATILIENSHEWQLCFLVQDYDGLDTIEGLVDFVKKDNNKAITKWASVNGQRVINAIELAPEQFSEWYADFLKRYYDEAFEKQWLSEQKNLVFEDANSVAKELKFLELSPTTFMENITGRKFSGSSKIILYPSSFSRPQHAYGFSENGQKVAVYQIGGGGQGVIGTIFHELMHPLIRGWWEAKRMKESVSELAKEPLFKRGWEQKGKHSYSYPEKWLDELVVHSVANYVRYKAGFISEETARGRSYGNYENALYDAIFDCYDSFDNIDDFLFYAINHIKVLSEDSGARFVYINDDDGQLRVQSFAGPINAVVIDKESAILIIPSSEQDETMQDMIHTYVRAVRDRFFKNSSILTDKEALEQDLSNNSIIAYGTMTGNLWLARYSVKLPVRISSEQIVADTTYAGSNLRFITTWPNPQNPQKGVVIYTAQKAKDVLEINSILHGPTDYVIARGTEIFTSANYKKQNKQWTFK